MADIELATKAEVDAFMVRMAEAMRKRERREKRCRFARTWGLLIITAILAVETIVLAGWAGGVKLP